MQAISKDAEIIKVLGGPSRVAELLLFPKNGGQQRVQNWLTRGIPSRVKVLRPDLFMPELAVAQSPPVPAATETVAGVVHA